MSNVGLDFSVFEDFRESVTAKLSATQTIELPLICGRDAPRAEILAKRIDLVVAKMAILRTRAEEIEKASLDKNVMEAVVTPESGCDLMDKINSMQNTHLVQWEDCMKQAECAANDVLTLITPYIDQVKLETGEMLVARLRKAEPRVVTDIFMCMLYGKSALEDKSNSGKAEEPKK